MLYVERPRTVEARLITSETLDEIAAWCGGQILTNGSILYQVGDLLVTAPLGTYLVLQNGMFSTHGADDFEAAWTPAEGE